jgi:hypothetical protein
VPGWHVNFLQASNWLLIVAEEEEDEKKKKKKKKKEKQCCVLVDKNKWRLLRFTGQDMILSSRTME